MLQLPQRTQIGAVITDGANLLILKRNPSRYKGWGLVKGGVDGDESLVEAVIRETHEETGLTITPDAITDLNHITAHYHQEKGYVAVVHWFVVTVDSLDVASLTLCPAEWVEAEALPPREAIERLSWQTEQGVARVAVERSQ